MVGGSAICVSLLLVASVAWKWRFQASPEVRLAEARTATAKENRTEFERVVGLMEADGQLDHARLARGEWHLREARKSLREVEQLHQLHSLALPMQHLLDGARWSLEAPAGGRSLFIGAMTDPQLVIRTPAFGTLLQLQTRVQGQLQLAYKQYSGIPQDTALFDEAALPAAEALLRLRETGAIVPLEGPYRLLQHVVQVRPNDLEAHRWLAVVCLDLNEIQGAMEETQAVGRLDPRDGRPYRSLGLLLRNRLKYGMAMDAYREALRRDLKPGVRLEVIAELAELEASKGMATESLKTLALCPPEFHDRPDLMAIRAEALWISNPQLHRNEAVHLLESTIRAQPDFVAALRLLGRIYLAESKLAEARRLLERAVKLAPHDHEARHQLVQCLELQAEPTPAAEHRRLAERSQRLKQELDDATLAASKEPLSEKPRLRAAKICIELGNLDSARQWLLAALACTPRDEEAQRLLAQVTRQSTALR